MVVFLGPLRAIIMRLTEYNYLANMQVYGSPATQICAIGMYLPETIVDNYQLVDLLDAPPDIKKRLPAVISRMTGIRTRRYAEPGTSPSDLACEAAKRALATSGMGLHEIDTLIFASTDMDTLEPSTANIIQKKMGIRLVNAFDVTNACNSFLQAMNVANSLIAAGAARRVLIVSGEVGSYVCNRSINSFDELDVKMGGLTLGDAGAAMVLEKAQGEAGLLEINLVSLGEYWETCHVPETTDWRQRKDGSIHGWFYLDMPELAKIAQDATVGYFRNYKAYRREIFAERFFLDHLAQVVPHQISRRFIENITKAVLPLASREDYSRICITADVFGNTASTAIPVALVNLLETHVLTLGSGQEVLLYGAASGFGVGHIRIRL